MKNLKIWSLALALLVAMTGCEPADKTGESGETKKPFNPVATSELSTKIQTAWQLVEYAGAEAKFDVFIEFAEGEFELYQRIYSTDYEKLTGTYNLNGATLTGVYSNDVEWNHTYTVKIAENPLRLRLIEENGTYAEYEAISEEDLAVIEGQAVETKATRATEYFL